MAIPLIWIDDEIEMLKSHLIFLENKGYKVHPVNNVTDALEDLKKQTFRAVLIDENMPGIGGLEAIPMIKQWNTNIPIIMITKNEEEEIMEEAIGKQIADYILKPVNPNQIILSLKKVLDTDKIVEEKTLMDYQQQFRQLSMEINEVQSVEEWNNLYKKLIYWQLKLDKIQDSGLNEILQTQLDEANHLFSNFVEDEYYNWVQQKNGPILSHEVFKQWVSPKIRENKKILLLMIDNMRLDQWKMIEPLFSKLYSKTEEKLYYSILPTATQYARNAFFAGMMPLEISQKYPNKWLNDPEEGNKNMYENDFLEDQLKRLGHGNIKHSYFKILNSDFENKISQKIFKNLKEDDFITIVYNFIDILSHAKTDNKIVNELIRDDKTYRALTYNWFENSYLLNIIRQAQEQGFQLIITTDHGTTLVQNASKVVGDRDTSTNLRYKLGRQLNYNENDVFAITEPEKFHLPKVNISSEYIFARENKFLAYPNNFNHFANYYKNTYQHGGISMEEMIIPFIILEN